MNKHHSCIRSLSADTRFIKGDEQQRIRNTINLNPTLAEPFYLKFGNKIYHSFSTALCEGCASDKCDKTNEILLHKVDQELNPIAFITVVEFLLLLQSYNNDVNIFDLRENRIYRQRHVRNASNASCHTKTMAKRAVPSCLSKIKQSGSSSKMIYVYDYKSNRKSFNNSTRMFCEQITNSGYQTIVVDGGYAGIVQECQNMVSDVGEALFETVDVSAVEALRNACVQSENVENNFCEDILNADISEIEEGKLWLGNQVNAGDLDLLRQKGISHILNVSKDIPNYFEKTGYIKYLRLAARDNCDQNLYQFFKNAIDFIDEATIAGGRVLVHCMAGVSRSPTIVAAYLMTKRDLDLTECLEKISMIRTIVSPNLSFLGQLQRYSLSLMHFKLQTHGNVVNDSNMLDFVTASDKVFTDSGSNSDSGLGTASASEDSDSSPKSMEVSLFDELN